MESRYQRNDWTPEQQLQLGGSSVSIIGCGGLGGYVAEMLARAGVGQLVLADGDTFEQSNLNRQRFAEEGTLGHGKASAAARALGAVNPGVVCRPTDTMLTENNGTAILTGSRAVVDCLDNVPGRFLLQRLCGELGLPLVHGAVSGWRGQVTTILPGERVMDKLYPGREYPDSAAGNKSTPFTPAAIAALEVSEVIKILLGEPPALHGRLLTIDMLAMETQVYSL